MTFTDTYLQSLPTGSSGDNPPPPSPARRGVWPKRKNSSCKDRLEETRTHRLEAALGRPAQGCWTGWRSHRGATDSVTPSCSGPRWFDTTPCYGSLIPTQRAGAGRSRCGAAALVRFGDSYSDLSPCVPSPAPLSSGSVRCPRAPRPLPRPLVGPSCKKLKALHV